MGLTKGIIDHYRVLDLTDEKGFLCGRVLGDLGADVIKVERPGGDPARRIGPFFDKIPHMERSLYWFAYNANKRGITLNIETKEGKEIFKWLVKTSDVIVESFAPGYLDELGLGYSTLSKDKPDIILTSITPFGQDGPYKNYEGPDIVVMGMGGSIYVSGDPDRPPVRISFPQAYLHAGAQAAAATLIALYYRETTGEGQHVDVSAQQCVALTLMNALETWDLSRQNLKRSGHKMMNPRSRIQRRQMWACKDGYVSMLLFGGFRAWTVRSLVKWMDDEGMANKFLLEFDWDGWDIEAVSQDVIDRIEEPISKFFMTHSMTELYKGAIARRILLFPVNDARDILEDEQLTARGFWQNVDHTELGTDIIYPSSFVRSSEAFCGIRHRAPLIGEHNVEIFENDLGINREELNALAQGGVI